MWQYSNHSPNHGHRNPAKPAATGSFIYLLLPLLRFFFSLLLRRLSAPPRCGSLHPSLSRADRTMAHTDRWRPGSSRGYYGPLRGSRDHTRRSERHSAGHDCPRGRSAAAEQGRRLRGRSRERSTLTRVRPSRRPAPSETRDRSMRRERSRSRERSTLSRLSSRRRTSSIQHREAGHTPGYSTKPEQRSLAHSQSQNTLNASKMLRNVRARVVQTHSLPMHLGPSTQGERTVANSAVLFQNHVPKS